MLSVTLALLGCNRCRSETCLPQKTLVIVGNLLKPNKTLKSVNYADDKWELLQRLCDLQRKLNDFANESSNVGLKFNAA